MTGSAVVDLRSTFGAGFVGLFVSTILFGVTIIQAWNYYWNYRSRDSWALKVLIAIVVGLDALHTVLCFHMFYWYLILNFGNVDSLQFNMWSLNSQGVIAVAASFLVQLTYARRVYILSNKIILPAVIAGAASICFVAGIFYAIKEFAIKRFSLYGTLTWLTCLGLGAILMADVLIALSLSWLLYHKKTGFARTDSVVMTLMSYSISSGLLTSVVCVGTVISYVIRPTTLIPDAFFWTLAKLHVNSLLAMLNSRNSILERSANGHPQTTFYVGSFKTQQQNQPTHESTTSRPTTISVNTHQTTTTDFASCKRNYDAEPKVLDVKISDGVNSTSKSTPIV